MAAFFQFLVIASSTYLIYLIFVKRNVMDKSVRLRMREGLLQVYNRMESKKWDDAFRVVGWSINSRTWNLIRYGSVFLYFLLSLFSMFLRGQGFSLYPFISSIIMLIVTSFHKYSLVGIVMNNVKRIRDYRRDGEWLSFLKLYEANLWRKVNFMQFPAFCVAVAPHFDLIKTELNVLSERGFNRGVEDALDWLIGQYPKDHLFMHHIRSIILSTDSVDQESALKFMRSQNDTISRICNDHYNKRWANISGVAGFVNVLPIVLILGSVIAVGIMRVLMLRGGMILY